MIIVVNRNANELSATVNRRRIGIRLSTGDFHDPRCPISSGRYCALWGTKYGKQSNSLVATSKLNRHHVVGCWAFFVRGEARLPALDHDVLRSALALHPARRFLAAGSTWSHKASQGLSEARWELFHRSRGHGNRSPHTILCIRDKQYAR